jgi:hypothetical protein
MEFYTGRADHTLEVANSVNKKNQEYKQFNSSGGHGSGVWVDISQI